MEFVHLQLNTFLLLLFTGIIWGAFFDLYRVFRSRIQINRVVDFIGDIIFWILAAVIIIPFIYWATWLELRLFVWIVIVLGLIIYFIFLSDILIPIFKVFWDIIGWFPQKIVNLIGYLKLKVHWWIRFFNRKGL
ncbi:MAG TPA: hypothetical protein DDW50_06360 [Firmicutes bacterium]|jgi:spore cortex biosynthesis protein YabQ|nr:hypothetical protein [Bacillota bacterium]